MPADACEINQNREWTEEAGGRLKAMRKEEKLSWEQAYFYVHLQKLYSSSACQ